MNGLELGERGDSENPLILEDKIKILSRSLSDMSKITEIDNLYNYLGNLLLSCYPNTCILISKVNEKKSEILPFKAAGIKSEELENITALVSSGYPQLKTSSLHLKLYKNEGVVRGLPFLGEYSGASLTEATKKIISKLKITDTFGFGICLKDDLLAVIQVGVKKNNADIDTTLAELLLKQTEIVIGKINAENALTEHATNKRFTNSRFSKFSKALEQSPISIVITNIKGEIEYVNPHFTQLTGYSREEVLGKNPRILKSGQMDASFYKNLWGTLTSGKDWRGEFKNKKKNGDPYIESAVIAPFFNENGIITHYVAVKEDITKRKEIEESLKENEKILHEAQQLSRIGHYIIDYKTRSLTCSPVIDDILGLDATFEKTLENFGKLIAPEFFLQMRDSFHEFTRAKKPFCYECKVKNYTSGADQWIIIKGELQYHTDESPKRYIGTVQDINERKKVEHDLILSNERLESLLRIAGHESGNLQELFNLALNEAIELTESKIGYIYLYSDTTKAFHPGAWSKELKDFCRPVVQKNSLNTDISDYWFEVIRTKKPIIINDFKSFNQTSQALSQGKIPIGTFLSIPIFSDGKMVAMIGVANKEADYNQSDVMQLTLMMNSVWKITERQKMIEELVIAKEKAIQSDKLKSAFLANMSHEIRTPMNAILGFSELLKKNIANPVSLEKFANIIHSRSVYLLTLIDDILNLSQVEAGIIRINPVKFSVNKLLDDLKQQVNNKLNSLNKNIDIVINKTRRDNDSSIYFDKTRLQQILNNIMENAIKFTSKGSITISYAEGPNGDIIFTVGDTGKGIPVKSQKLLFERFHKSDDYSFNYGGLGLGLSICKGILDVLGGKIWAESEENIGTQISFSIPATFIVNNKTVTSKVEKKDHVLIVEDDLYNIVLYRNFLNEFNLIITEDGFSALKVFAQNEDIGVILMDIGLADLNGIEVTKKIRETNTTIPIIAVTAYTGELDKELCLNAGCNEFLPKPVDFESLKGKIKNYIES